tara:strand:+ start:1089 stop:1994 length:906 start_codon:yes stop_codon:yes gene_type:complete
MKFFKIVLSISLLTFSFEVYAQSNKPVIGIGDMQSSVGGDVNTFRAMLETALANTNKFELIERSRIGDLISEQALSAGGITEGSGQIGGISGVDYLVYGSITKLGVESNEFNLGDYKSASQDGVMSVDLRVVDVSTGSIKISETVEVESSVSSAINIDGRSIGGDEADPLSSVQRVAAVQIAGKIALNIFPIKVINVKDNMVYLNYGSSILSKCSWSSSESCYLKIVELGEGFVDPDTGEVLGAEEEYVGAVEVTEPKSKFTIAKILEGNITRGAIAVQMSKSDGNKIKKKIKANKKKKKR